MNLCHIQHTQKWGGPFGPPPDESVDFTLDRPFLFAITGDMDLPLFVGVVNQPNG